MCVTLRFLAIHISASCAQWTLCNNTVKSNYWYSCSVLQHVKDKCAVQLLPHLLEQHGSPQIHSPPPHQTHHDPGSEETHYHCHCPSQTVDPFLI